MPFTDIQYFADKKWWDWHKEREEFKALTAEKATVFATGAMVDDPAVHMLRNTGARGISEEPDALRTGCNSGHQAINIAVHMGAKRIVLLGYDAKQGKGGKTHFFGDHPDKTQAPYANQVYELKHAMPFFEKRGVELINATPGSALTFVPFKRLAEVLA